MHHTKRVLSLVLFFAAFAMVAGTPARATSSHWDVLSALRPGQLIEIVTKDGKSYRGELKAVNGEAITTRQGGTEQTFAQQDVSSISVKGKNHRLLNTAIGGAVGTLFIALPLHLINNRNSFWMSEKWIWWIVPAASAGFGAQLPTARFHEVYHARQHKARRGNRDQANRTRP